MRRTRLVIAMVLSSISLAAVPTTGTGQLGSLRQKAEEAKKKAEEAKKKLDEGGKKTTHAKLRKRSNCP